jgi:diaminohydroxyphosphoribosylaminopyrimidine deaminase/5-amino-6-(5-phosphoribosylamino)uracil reductase
MLSESTLNETMRVACAEARKWLGATTPNPPVGAAALDAEGKIIALTAHRRAGELHAEAELIEQCRRHGTLGRIRTLCITLECCNHQGRTPACTETIVASGIKHVAIGTRDPNPHVKGGGVEYLRQKGVEVTLGVNEEECRQLISSFAYTVKAGKPFVTLKRAFDAHKSMIPSPGQKVFTSVGSRRFAHRLRKRADAILTGSGTILADNPLFTVREVQDYPDKRRWLGILDRRRRVPELYREKAAQRGVDCVIYQDINEAFLDLARKGAQDILVEAGVALSQAILDHGLWTMRVDIHQAEPHDRMETLFNPAAHMPFDPHAFHWDYVLPA